MAVLKETWTEVYCDDCGKLLGRWVSVRGVSIEWAKYFVRQKGATTGKRIKCKKCRIKARIEKCSLIKKYGSTEKNNDTCSGFVKEFDDETIEECKRCIAHNSFDWKEEEIKNRKKI